ncbi:MAG: UDP-N-acetylmuramate dehydrogenase [Deltaproteobacteria bacterium]|nr:UDP-N-acetylmuramate dehydrogenase [Deltaproteobacteria bacterium]
MDYSIKNAIKKLGGDSVIFDFPMSKYTTIRAGGKAEVLFRAGNLEGLREVLLFLVQEQVSYLTIGKGSNILILDGGLDGVVIMLGGSLAFVDDKIVDSGLFVGSAMALPKLVAYCAKNCLAGIEFLAGIPGTLGGAIAMNAGSMGKEIKDVVLEVYFLNKKGEIERKDISELKFQYRELAFNTGDIILSARLNLVADQPSLIKDRIFKNIKDRNAKFPFNMPSAGSIFKNPDGDYAGRLIELSGLKGKGIGGAAISNEHGNFIVTKGKASASDVVELMNLAKNRVKELFNITLTPEIKIVGKP